MSVFNGLEVERGASYERKTRSATREREGEVDHTRQKETPTTRASPFIVHNTSLLTLHPKISSCLVKSINCYRGTWQGFAKQKETGDLYRLVSIPFHQIQTGGGGRKREAGHIHWEGRQYYYTLMYYRALQSGLPKGRLMWQAQRGLQQTLAHRKFYHMN